MEIRNALQKIENYLTVVSNLNKTILSEGTMSRDELLLMKKYLYTSIDRIEDIERSLIIDKKSDKSFTPTATSENKFTPAKEKEIVEVQETDHIEDVEAKLTNEQKDEFEDMVEEIQTEISAEQKEIVGEVERPKIFQQDVTELPVAENIITEDYSLNRNAIEENKIAETVVENTPVMENIITEDYSLNRNAVEENKIAETIIENTPVMENIITEDYSLNRNSTEENIVSKAIVENEKATTVLDLIPLVENIITEDYSLNRNVTEVSKINEITPEITAEVKPEINNASESISEKFEDNKPKTFVEVLADKKKEETSYIEQLEQQTNTKPQSQLFQLFDDGKEDLHESFANNSQLSEPVNTVFDKPVVNSAYGQNENVMVAEKEVNTMVEQLTPSSLNNVFKPQTLAENITGIADKTLSESIALNDKFIFVRELFGNQFDEYENSLKHIDTLSSYFEAEQYCNTKLWNKFNWTERASAAGRFMDLIQKKYK